MTTIKLIALDLDGTVLDDRKQIPEENRVVLKEAESRGIHMAVVSGRMMPRIEAVLHLLEIDCSIIAYNGAKMWGQIAEGRPVIFHQPMDAEVSEFLVHFSRENGYPLNFYHEDRMFAEPRPQRQELRTLYANRTGARYEYVNDLLLSFPRVQPTKLLMLADPEECVSLLAQLREQLAGRIFITRSEPEYLEMMAPGIDKGDGLLRLARHYGIHPDETMALGDAENDIEMLRAAAVGVAMANAPPQVRAAASFVTKRTNNEAGVAEAIRRFAFERS